MTGSPPSAEAVAGAGGGIVCSRCGRQLAPAYRRRKIGKRRRPGNELVGYRCGKCGAGFTPELAREPALDEKRR